MKNITEHQLTTHLTVEVEVAYHQNTTNRQQMPITGPQLIAGIFLLGDCIASAKTVTGYFDVPEDMTKQDFESWGLERGGLSFEVSAVFDENIHALNAEELDAFLRSQAVNLFDRLTRTKFAHFNPYVGVDHTENGATSFSIAILRSTAHE